VSGQQHVPAASTPGKEPVPLLQEAGWAPGPVWTGGKSRPHRDSIPDRPACSSVAKPTELPGLRIQKRGGENEERIIKKKWERQESAVAIFLLCSNSVCSVLPTTSIGHMKLISVPEIY